MTFSELNLVAETDYEHVSNVKLFEYLDKGRKIWYEHCKLFGVHAFVVNITVSYQKEVFHQELLHIRTCLEQVGNTSFTLKQEIYNADQSLVVTAEVVLVTLGLKTKEKENVPEEIRQFLHQNQPLK